MQKYPIGLQDFRGIREGSYLYVDKTRNIHTLIESGKYYFLSRPRRFGKSLLLSTIKEVFGGDRRLFKGLWIENNWDWNQRHPVINFSFASIGVRTLGLTEAISKSLNENAARLGISLDEKVIDQQFRELIRKASADANVIVLIDEYDKPIIDNLDNIALAQENRSLLKNFFSILKDSDEYIRLLLITGVSKFTKVSIFSDLNNLRDITLSPQFATLTGITQEELEHNFAHEIRDLQKTTNGILQEIRDWYNGYSWNGVHRVYNPFSLLNFMTDRQFRNYWFATGTPTFLVDQIRKRKEFRFEGLRMGELGLGNFNIEHIAPAPLLFQTGYLTIKSYDPTLQLYELDYPNREVKSSLLDALLSAYREVSPGDSLAITGDLLMALRSNDIAGLIEGLNALIATIPYEHWRADTESIFHIILHLTFRIIGVNIQSEVHSAVGRCDAIVHSPTHIYALEFKLDRTAREALHQISERGYLRPFESDKREKVAIGINFSSTGRKIDEYMVGIGGGR